MKETIFFSDSMAAVLAEALTAAGYELPVLGQVSEAEAEQERVEVRVSGVDELVPGNFTMRIDGEVVLVLGAALHSAAECEALAVGVGDVVRAVLGQDWRYKPLPWPESWQDEAERAQYEQLPFVVLEMVVQPANVNAGSGWYECAVEYRAYVQF